MSHESMKAGPVNSAQRIAELEAALSHERLRSTELERRAAALEEALQRSYRMIVGRPRTDATSAESKP